MYCLLVPIIIGAILLVPGITVAQESNEETVSLEVRRVEDDGKVLQVSLRVHVIDGIIHINKHRLNHAVITAIHLQAQIIDNGKSHPAMVHVRVMVGEAAGANGIKMLTVQEEIVEVDQKKVVQLNVKEIVLHVGKGKKEVRRSITTISLKESKIHGINSNKDTHIYTSGGKLPETPYKASEHDMELFNKVPVSHLKPPKLPESPLRGGEDEDYNSKDGRKGKNRHHYVNVFLQKRGFCKWFHNLSVVSRIFICLGVLILGGSLFACCAKCLCGSKSKKMEGQKIGEAEDEEKKVEDDEIEEEQVGPLPNKKPLDEMQLIV